MNIPTAQSVDMQISKHLDTLSMKVKKNCKRYENTQILII